jgi:8-oxo-dGTP pyrophosphatase MutT (NUDIX family)
MKNKNTRCNINALCQSKERLSNHIGRLLNDYSPKTIVPHKTAYRKAAVLIPLFFKDNEAHILFTKRSYHLKHHKGQISFPGGAWEAHDRDLKTTALRETFEEVGIPQKEVELLGGIDELLSPSGFLITPYIGIFNYPLEYKVNNGEIDRIIESPLIHLLNDNHFYTKPLKRSGKTFDVHFYNYHNDIIWGITGFLLSNFFSIIFNKNR